MPRSGTQMIAALEAAACPVERLVLPGCDHFSSHLNTRTADDLWTARARRVMSDIA